MHEVGHTLGLKHNFKGSTVCTRRQLQDRDFTEKNGISGSVMDYNAFNLAVRGEQQGELQQQHARALRLLGDRIRLPAVRAGDESGRTGAHRGAQQRTAAGLRRRRRRGGVGGNDGIDPLVNRFDLGDDPLEYYKKRLLLSRELWERAQGRAPQPGDPDSPTPRADVRFPPVRPRRGIGRQIRRRHAHRARPSRNHGRAAYAPVEPAKQREALQFLAKGLFNADSFRFKPQFLASLSPDYNEWERAGPVNISASVLQVQTAALDRLLSPGTAARLLDLPLYVEPDKARDIISLPEVYLTLQNAVWSELKTGAEIDRLRRNLQREHLKRLQALLTRGSPALPPDALSLARLHANELLADLKRVANSSKLSIESRAHVQDSLALLTEALRASMQRS